MMKVPIAKPYLGEEEKRAVSEVLDSGWLVQGPKVAEFERLVCEFTGAKAARATSSCTTALHLALVALAIGPGDTVLVPSFTFVASANAVEHAGARPVFVDIDLSTFVVRPEAIEHSIQEAARQNLRIKCIMPVQEFGLCADMEPILSIASKYHLFVLEDAACAMGSTYRDRHAGTMGNAGCFSFHPRKSLVTGEGGMLITNEPTLAAKVECLRTHGATVSDFSRHEKGGYLLPAYDSLGYNYRMTDMQAAIGIEQIKKLPRLIQRRIEIAKRYDDALADVEWLQTPSTPKGRKHVYQSYVAMVRKPHSDPTNIGTVHELNRFRNSVMKELEERGVATRQGTHAVHTLGYYREKYGLKDDDYPCSLAADRLSIALPLYPQMTEEEQEYVVENLLAVGATNYRSVRL